MYGVLVCTVHMYKIGIIFYYYVYTSKPIKQYKYIFNILLINRSYLSAHYIYLYGPLIGNRPTRLTSRATVVFHVRLIFYYNI